MVTPVKGGEDAYIKQRPGCSTRTPLAPPFCGAGLAHPQLCSLHILYLIKSISQEKDLTDFRCSVRSSIPTNVSNRVRYSQAETGIDLFTAGAAHQQRSVLAPKFMPLDRTPHVGFGFVSAQNDLPYRAQNLMPSRSLSPSEDVDLRVCIDPNPARSAFRPCSRKEN